MKRGHRTPLLATVAATGLLLAACGGEAVSVTTDDEARQAVVDTFATSWNAEMRVDVDITDAQVDTILDAIAQADGTTEVDLQGARQMFDTVRTQAEGAQSVFARADDGSYRFASIVDDEPAFDLRLDVSQLVAADTLMPEVSVLVLADIEVFLDQMRESFEMMADMDPSMPSGAPEMPELSQLRAQAKMFLPSGPVEDMVLQVMDGGFGGAVGQLDLAALGATQEDLDQARDEFFGELEDVPIDADDLAGVVREALTIRDLTPADGGTRGVVDLHPRAIVEAIGELSEAAGEVDDFRQDFADDTGMTVDELPETIAGVATIAFDGAGHLREITLPLVEIARQVIDHFDEVPAEAQDLMAELQDARYDAVLTLSDVGSVGTVLDVEATTVSWDELIETLEEYGMAPGKATASEGGAVEVEPAA